MRISCYDKYKKENNVLTNHFYIYHNIVFSLEYRCPLEIRWKKHPPGSQGEARRVRPIGRRSRSDQCGTTNSARSHKHTLKAGWRKLNVEPDRRALSSHHDQMNDCRAESQGSTRLPTISGGTGVSPDAEGFASAEFAGALAPLLI